MGAGFMRRVRLTRGRGGYIEVPSLKDCLGGRGARCWQPFRRSRTWRRLAWAEGRAYDYLVVLEHRRTGQLLVWGQNGCLMGDRELKPGESVTQLTREMAAVLGLKPRLLRACLRRLAKAEQERV